MSERYDLKGIVIVPIESLGMTRNVPVYFASRCIIYSDFVIIKNHLRKLMLILPNTLLDEYNYDLLASKWKLRLKCNGKEFFIPINIHKVKNKLEVNCVNITSKYNNSLSLDCILQDSQNLQ